MNNEQISNYFTGLLARNDSSHQVLDWGSQQSQNLRFQILAGIDDLDGKMILDVGCGLCDLYAWLQTKKIKVDYLGVDITEAMVHHCRKRFPELTVKQVDILSQHLPGNFDYVVASGIFYLLDSQDQALPLIKAMFDLATCGVAFNSLSCWGEQTEKDELCLEPGEILSFCRTLTSKVVLRHDYLPHDFTIYLYKDPT